MNKFAERMRELMNVKGLAQNSLAVKLNVAQRTVSRWCSGEREPSLDNLLLICRELDESPNYMIGWED